MDRADCWSSIGLLEHLAWRSGCPYLSDLRYLAGWDLMRLSREVFRIPAEAFPLTVWNDALDYLTGSSPAADASAAREELIRHLAEKALER